MTEERKWIIPEARNQLTKKQIKDLFLSQQGLCPRCGQPLQTKGHMPVEFIDEHVKRLSVGGTNELSNRALYCKPCARDKTSAEATEHAKGNRAFEKQVLGFKRRKSKGFRGWRKMNGEIVWRDDN